MKIIFAEKGVKYLKNVWNFVRSRSKMENMGRERLCKKTDFRGTKV